MRVASRISLSVSWRARIAGFTLGVPALLSLTASCSGEALLERMVDHGDDAFARAYFDSVRAGRLDYAVKVLSPQLSQVPGVRDSLGRISTYLPHGVVDSIHLIGANRLRTSSVDRTLFAYEYHSANGCGVTNVAVTRELGIRYIERMRADTIPRSLESLNAFTLRGKGAGHFLMLALMLACAAASITGVVAAIRTPMRRRRLWALLSLVGAGVFSFNWTTGQGGFSIFNLLLFAAGAVRGGLAAPWIISAAFPVGALLTLRRVRQARNSVASPPTSETAPSVGA